jgi:preprotein translocase subunit YajC
VKELASLLPLLLILALFWLLAIRPQQRRNAALAQLQSSLELGDEVMLSSGFLGIVRGFDDDRVRIELADGVVVQVMRAAIHRVVEPAGGTDADDPDDTEPTASTEEG